ncbi:hypothetical protein CTEN210_14976 [Chaetoceros tenuissimus]|uniref:Uncharacterized protein n=1 Tax=Chaetoceros tenuissimus TaxID=426638 RepID=A0AAD3D803_9STRA|nr:hypothetical protein CTEN210_14976 [Chaetoceros tenuissimus]
MILIKSISRVAAGRQITRFRNGSSICILNVHSRIYAPFNTPFINNTDLSDSLRQFSTDNKSNLGQEYYEKAKQHLYLHEKSLQEKQQQQENHQYDSKSGLQVVKKIVNQVRQERKEQLNGIEIHHSQVKEKANDLELAKEYMQIAAFRYGFNHAIVSLANDLLTKQDFDLEKELKHVYGLDRNDLVFDLGELQHCPSGAHLAMKLYEFAGANDCAEAWFNLGHLLWTGHEIENNVEKSIKSDIEKAIECFEKAVKLGDDDAKYFMGVTYLGEDHIDAESYESILDTRRKGLQYIQEAADNGHIGALYYLALLYRNGDDDLEIQSSLDLFQEYLNEACDGGEADSLFLRGHCRYHGDDGYEVDVESALNDFLEAGEAGNSDALVSAGAIYHKGSFKNIPRDQRRAFELYQQAGEMGNIEGWRNVVACYTLGEGVPKSEDTAKYIQKTMLDKI